MPSVPQLHEHVTDFTNTLQYSEWRTIETELKRFEDSTSTQIAVVMIQSLQGDDIADYSLKIAEANKIGTKGKDNGLVILISKDDKKIRFEVGYGLEGSLPDALCDQIIRNEIRPRFRDGDYFGGIRAGVDAAIMATKGEYKPKGGRKTKYLNFGSVVMSIILFVVFGMSIFGGGRRYGISSRGHYQSGYWGGGFWRRRIFWWRRVRRRRRRWGLLRRWGIIRRRRGERKLVGVLLSQRLNLQVRMLIVMRLDASRKEIDAVKAKISSFGFSP